jgi:hypothetical protein
MRHFDASGRALAIPFRLVPKSRIAEARVDQALASKLTKQSAAIFLQEPAPALGFSTG